MAPRYIIVLFILFSVAIFSEAAKKRKKNNAASNVWTKSAKSDNSWAAWFEVGNEFRCNAVLVNSRWLVTSAKCVISHTTEEYTAYLGDYNRAIEGDGEKAYAIDKVVLHPMHDGEHGHDVALMRLKGNANDMRPKVTPMGWMSTEAIDNKLEWQKNQQCYTVGWGSRLVQRYGKSVVRFSAVLQQLPVIITDNITCQEQFYTKDLDHPICTYNKYNGPCSDSLGSATVCKMTRGWILVGIDSFYKKNDCKGGYFGLTRMSRYHAWIRNTFKDVILSNSAYGEPCVPGRPSVCADKGALCEGATYRYICQCAPGFIAYQGVCLIDEGDKDIGEYCVKERPDACGDPNAECRNLMCVCKPTYIAVNGVCLLARDMNETCNVTGQCTPVLSVCDGGICTCANATIEKNGSCYAERALTEPCQIEEQCVGNFQECFDDTCICQAGYVGISAVCYEEVGLGGSCTLSGQCMVEGSTCTGNVCACSTNFPIENNGSCYAERALTEACDISEQCVGDQQQCSNTGFCECVANLIVINAACYEEKSLGEACEVVGQCTEDRVNCTNLNCTCETAYPIEKDGACFAEKAFEESCNHTEQCTEDNQECSGGECACVSGYIDYQDVCYAECTDANQYRCLSASDQTPICAIACDSSSECQNGEDELCDGSLDDTCVHPDQCNSTENVECDLGTDTCVCTTNYTEIEGACGQAADFGENCTRDAECVGNNQICDTVCVCEPAHLEINGECLPEAVLNENCTEDAQCTGDNQECDRDVCSCVAFHHVVNETCISSSYTGDQCNSSDNCVGLNQECDSGSNTCVCVSGYILDGIQMNCRIIADLDEACVDSNQCTGANQECAGGNCSCQANFHEFNGTCIASADLTEGCTQNENCIGVDQICTGNVCECLDTHVVNGTGTGCLIIADLDEACVDSNQCTGANQECAGGNCSCQANFHEFNGTCIASADLTEGCTQNENCIGVDQICTGNVCECLDTHVVNGTGCLIALELDETCLEDVQCNGTNQECVASSVASKTCQCIADHHENNSVCYATAILGEGCTFNENCVTSLTSCQNSVCACNTNYVAIDGNCTEERDLGEVCTRDEECVGEGQQCKNGNCTCLDDFEEKDGVCKNGSALGEACESNDDCLGSNQECANDVCTCLSGYLNVTNECLAEAVYGQACTQDGQCIEGNQTCNVTSSTCACADGYIYLVDKCYPERSRFQSCTLDGQCTLDKNTICNDDFGTCRCDAANNFRANDFGECVATPCTSGLPNAFDNTINVTKSGNTCQRWDSTSPHWIIHPTNGTFINGGSATAAENYCRDPDDFGSFWCYTDDAGTLYEPCDIVKCGSFVRLGEECTKFEECEGFYVECTNNVCACQSTHVQVGDHCFKKADLYEPAVADEQCADAGDGEGVVADQDFGQCRCDKSVNYRIEGDTCEIKDCYTFTSDTYADTESFTKSGYTCQAWNVQSPNTHGMTDASLFPDATLADASNYCRDPGGLGVPWCFTTESGVRWEACDINECETDTCVRDLQCDLSTSSCNEISGLCECETGYVQVNRDCFVEAARNESCVDDAQCITDNHACDDDTNTCQCDASKAYQWDAIQQVCILVKPCISTSSRDFDGIWSTTQSGITCQRWDSQTPYSHGNTNPNQYPEDTMEEVGNNCRDPDGTGYPWCYTTSSSRRWETCGIQGCCTYTILLSRAT